MYFYANGITYWNIHCVYTSQLFQILICIAPADAMRASHQGRSLQVSNGLIPASPETSDFSKGFYLQVLGSYKINGNSLFFFPLIPSAFQVLYSDLSSVCSSCSWFFFQIRDRNIVSFFYIRIHNFSSIICWIQCFFSNVYFCMCIKENSSGWICMCLLTSVISIDQHVYLCAYSMLFLLPWFCVILLKPNEFMMPSASFFFWLRNALIILGVCAFKCILELL